MYNTREDMEFGRFFEQDKLYPSSIQTAQINAGSQTGQEWIFTEVQTLAEDGTRAFLIQPRNKTSENHLFISMTSSDNCTLEIYEKPTFSANGTELSPVNTNRIYKYNAKAKLRLYHTPTITDNGTLLYKELGTVLDSKRLALNSNYFYYIKITSSANDNELSILLDWFEKKIRRI